MEFLAPRMLLYGVLSLLALTCPRPGRAEAIPDPAWLREKLEAVRVAHGLPGLAAAVVLGDEIVAASAVGVRRLGGSATVQRDDRFHLGSISKPLTATLVGVGVQRGWLKWTTTMEEMFPELLPTMQPDYRKVTVAQLLAHVSGMPYTPRADTRAIESRGANAPGRRYVYVKAAVVDPPEAAPGAKFIYSGGAIIVANYLERRTGVPYEEMMRAEIFAPLGLTTAGFGNMATVGTTDGPWEHPWQNGRLLPLAPRTAMLTHGRGPVGSAVMSVADLARFARLHLAGAHGRTDFLAPEIFAALHTAVPGSHMAPGWGGTPGRDGRMVVLGHAGSNGNNYSNCIIEVNANRAFCVMTNAGGEGGTQACGEIETWLRARFTPPAR
jgi:D-alanyl-D-alanine carboxypeptidase